MARAGVGRRNKSTDIADSDRTKVSTLRVRLNCRDNPNGKACLISPGDHVIADTGAHLIWTPKERV